VCSGALSLEQPKRPSDARDVDVTVEMGQSQQSQRCAIRGGERLPRFVRIGIQRHAVRVMLADLDARATAKAPAATAATAHSGGPTVWEVPRRQLPHLTEQPRRETGALLRLKRSGHTRARVLVDPGTDVDAGCVAETPDLGPSEPSTKALGESILRPPPSCMGRIRAQGDGRGWPIRSWQMRHVRRPVGGPA
jgi:hypothetical protein